jgi:hypothetical protein
LKCSHMLIFTEVLSYAQFTKEDHAGKEGRHVHGCMNKQDGLWSAFEVPLKCLWSALICLYFLKCSDMLKFTEEAKGYWSALTVINWLWLIDWS